MYPIHILSNGNGKKEKGFKCEWMAVKDDVLIIGSMGKEFAKGKVQKIDGFFLPGFKVREFSIRGILSLECVNLIVFFKEIVNMDSTWVKVIDLEGRLKHIQWNDKYQVLRKHTGAEFPGYLLHESAGFNPVLREWVFLPRRCK